MTCSEFEPRVAALAVGKGTLTDTLQRDALLLHAAGCQRCATLLEDEQALESQLRAALRPPVPAGLKALIHATLAEQTIASPPPPTPPPLRRPIWYLPVLATLIGLLATGWWTWGRTDDEAIHSTLVSGSALVVTDTGSHPLSDAAVLPGQRIIVGIDSSVALQYRDAMVWLGPTAEVTVGHSASEGRSVLELAAGQVFAAAGRDTEIVITSPAAATTITSGIVELRTSSQPQPSSPQEPIMTGKATAVAVVAASATTALIITVFSGNADVTNAQGQVHLRAGEQSVVSQQASPTKQARHTKVAELQSLVADLERQQGLDQAEIIRLTREMKTLRKIADTAAADAAEADAGPRPDAEVISDVKALIDSLGMNIVGLSEDHPLLKELKAMGPQGVSLLGTLLKAGSPSERLGAAAALEKLGDSAAFPLLEEALFGGDNDDNLLVQRMASHAIAMIGGSEAVPLLERIVEDGSEWGVRTNAAYSLATMGLEPGVNWLSDSFNAADDRGQQLMLLATMAQVGDPSYLPQLHRVLQDETEYSWRYTAVTGIAKAARQDSLPVLLAIINSVDEDKMIIDAAQKAYDEIVGEP